MTDSRKESGSWPTLDWAQSIPDPIWNNIAITELEQKLLQTKAFSRLRGIKQLGFAYLSFPGATHSRFEHSLGVMQVSDRLLKYLTYLKPEHGGIVVKKSSHRQLLRIAALLHDIGHAPFSHTVEDVLTMYPEFNKVFKTKLATKPDRHEYFTEMIIREDEEIKSVLKPWVEEIGREGITNTESQQNAFIRDVIATLAVGKDIPNQKSYAEYGELGRVFKTIMSGDIDADKIDYLARDNYYCGLPYSLDINWLRKKMRIEKGDIELLPEGVKFVITIILARYSLSTEVHQDEWDTLTKSIVIERLEEVLRKKTPKQREKYIKDLFTKKQDSDLLSLFPEDGFFRKTVLTKRYRLQEIERLDFWDSHPYIRQAMEVLAEHPEELHTYVKALRNATKKEVYATVRRVKLPEFTTKVKEGSLLRNDILRGISEETVRNLHIVVLGQTEDRGLSKDKSLANRLPAKNEKIDGYVENLAEFPLKKLLAHLVIESYRRICQNCAKRNELLPSDFLLLVMEFITRKKDAGITRQHIYKAARAIYSVCENEGLKKIVKLAFSEPEITPEFHREIRKYEQLGLLTYSGYVNLLPEEDKDKGSKNEKSVFRFDRRFILSINGSAKLEKIKGLSDSVKQYKEYIALWKRVFDLAERKRGQIESLINSTIK